MFQINSKEETFKLDRLNPIRLTGFSRSAYRTGFIIHPYNIYLDAGLHPTVKSNLILVSHTHYDHIASLYPILLESKTKDVMIPSSSKDNISEMLNIMSKLNCGKTIFNWNPIMTHNFDTKIIGKNIYIEIYKLDHRIDTNGYGIYEKQNKLKDEFKQLSSSEISILKKNKTEICERIFVPIIMFINDTGNKVLSKLPFCVFKLVIIECTFIEDNHYQESLKRKHLHWNDLKHYIKINNNTTFILTHFSSRYKNEYLIDKEFNLQKEYPNIKFWI